MLGLGHDTLRLGTTNLCCAHSSSEEWIFAERVVGAMRCNIAINVDEGLQNNVDTESTGLATNDGAVRFGVLDAERGSHTHGGSFGLRGNAREEAGRAVSEAQRRNVKAGNSREIAGLALIGGGIFDASADEIHFFFKRELLENCIDAGFADAVCGDDLSRGKSSGEAEEDKSAKTLPWHEEHIGPSVQRIG